MVCHDLYPDPTRHIPKCGMIPIMNRRRFLRSVVGGIPLLATGCVSGSGAGGGSDPTIVEETTFNEEADSEAETTIAEESTGEGQSTAETTVQDALEPPSLRKRTGPTRTGRR